MKRKNFNDIYQISWNWAEFPDIAERHVPPEIVSSVKSNQKFCALVIHVMYVTNVLLYLANFISLEMEDLNILIRRTDIVSKRFPFTWSLRIKCNFYLLRNALKADILRSGWLWGGGSSLTVRWYHSCKAASLACRLRLTLKAPRQEMPTSLVYLLVDINITNSLLAPRAPK